MNRSDIGEYLGMSLEAVSRAFRVLTTRGIIKSRDRRHLKIADRSTFDEIAADMSIKPLDRRRSDAASTFVSVLNFRCMPAHAPD
jgi:DNA-binding transcriptional regulator YhcF (GntR family)